MLEANHDDWPDFAEIARIAFRELSAHAPDRASAVETCLNEEHPFLIPHKTGSGLSEYSALPWDFALSYIGTSTVTFARTPPMLCGVAFDIRG